MVRNPYCQIGISSNHPKSTTVNNGHPSNDKGLRQRDMPVIRKSAEPCSRNSFDFLDNPQMPWQRSGETSMLRPAGHLVMQWFKPGLAVTDSGWKRWHGSFPLSINSLEKASCLLELGSYKSFKNYLSRIKEIHTEAGYMWTQALQNAAPRCTRSVLRGLGGPSKSEAFDLDGVVRHLLCNDIAVTEDGPDHRWQQWS